MSDAYDAAARAAILRAVRQRRTVHDFEQRPVPPAIVDEALEAARWAPNHHRTEPWRFYLLGEKAQQAIADRNAEIVAAARGERVAEVKRRRWLEMPGWLVMTVSRSDETLRAQEDYAACCCAAQNLMLALWAAGIGMKWTTGAVVRTSAFARIVGFDERAERVVGLFWYGYPATVTEQQRRPVESFLTRVE